MTPEPLTRFPVVVPQTVAWGEMDAFGHVNNVVYFRYFEAARIEYLTRVGWMDAKDRHGVGPIVHSTQARFRKAVVFPDDLLVGARATELAADRTVITHSLWSRRENAVAAEGQVVVVNFDYRNGVKSPIPAEMWSAILTLEQTCGNAPKIHSVHS